MNKITYKLNGYNKPFCHHNIFSDIIIYKSQYPSLYDINDDPISIYLFDHQILSILDI